MTTLDLQAIKVRQKATWESGDFGQVAKTIMPIAGESETVDFFRRYYGPTGKAFDVLRVIARSNFRAVSKPLRRRALKRHKCRAPGRGLQPASAPEPELTFGNRYRPGAQAALHRHLVDLQTAHNSADTPDTTEARAEYLEVVAVRG